MGLATLGGIPFRIDPMAISWAYIIKTAVTDTVGGKVVQVFGTEVSDLTLNGKFSSWKEQEEFLNRVRGWIDSITNDYSRPPLRFTYAPRGWDFLVYVSQFDQHNATSSHSISHPWSLTLFIVEDNGGLRTVKESALSAYIDRLAKGIGWKQTAYNGPMGAEEAQSYITGQGVDGVQDLLTRGEGHSKPTAPPTAPPPTTPAADRITRQGV